MKLLLISLCILLSFTKLAENRSFFYLNDLVNHGKIDSIIAILEKYENSNEITDTTLLIKFYHKIGVHYFDNGNYIKSIRYNEEAANLRTKVKDNLLWKSYRNIGICYKNLNQYQKAKHFFEMALEIYSKREPKNEYILLEKLAFTLIELGEYERAANLLSNKFAVEDTLTIRAKAKALNQLADALFLVKTNNIHKSIKYLNRSIQISKSLKDKKTECDSYTIYARIYDFLGDYEEVIKYSELCLNLFNEFDYLADSRNNIASALLSQKRYRASINKLEESIDIYKEHYNSTYNYEYAGVYENLADNYTAIEQFDSAFFFYQKTLINLTNNFRNEDIFQNPNYEDTTLYVYSKPDMIRVLHLKAVSAHQYYKQNKNTKYINLAHQTNQALIDFHNKLQQDISTENSRLFQSKNILEYLEHALEVAFTKQLKGSFDGEATFRLMEKNKVTVLLQSMNEADALQFANLPDSLIEQEKELKLYTSEYKRQLNDAKINEDTITVINDLENTLFENKEKYHQLIKNLEENYPNYYQLKYQQNQATLSEVQSQLNEKTAILEYFIGDKHIYLLSIQQDQSQLYQIEKPMDWEKRIEDFVGIFKRPSLGGNLHSSTQVERFSNQAFYFYEMLLQQPLVELEESTSHLQVIPDAELNYLPFEVLLYKQPDPAASTLSFNKLPYLIKNKAIGYAYSANLWLDNLETQPLNNPITYGGYASKHQIDETYDDLPKPREQVQKTAKLFKGVPYIAKLATKSTFMEDDNSYQISHFAMHGIVNDTLPLNSHLVFTLNNSKDFKLYASDLYNKKLNTELAVLNACNTGTGQLQKGEGVMSLSRAFTYAGCPSLVMSLWSIPDVSSARVLDDFFINLKNGATKDVALQKAKLNFLETSEKTHPIYWAGLVVVGNLESIKFKSEIQLSLIALIALLFLVGGFLVKKYWFN